MVLPAWGLPPAALIGLGVEHQGRVALAQLGERVEGEAGAPVDLVGSNPAGRETRP
jgi:hypothetical protein